jgi:hypothetical protein
MSLKWTKIETDRTPGEKKDNPENLLCTSCKKRHPTAEVMVQRGKVIAERIAKMLNDDIAVGGGHPAEHYIGLSILVRASKAQLAHAGVHVSVVDIGNLDLDGIEMPDLTNEDIH